MRPAAAVIAGSATPDGPPTGRRPIATPILTWAAEATRPTVAVVHNGVIENHAVLRRELEAEGLRLPEPDRHRGHRPPDRPRAGAARRAVRGRPAGPAPARGHLRASPSSARGIPARSSAPGSAVRWWSAWATTSTCWPAMPWRSRRTRRRWPTSRTARSSGSRPATSRSATASTGRSRRGSTGSTGSPTPSSWAATPTTCSRRSASSPRRCIDACRGRLRRAEATAQFGGLNMTARQLRRVRRVVFAACGTSWHAAMVGEYLIERLAHLPVEVEYASEFRYRDAPLDDRTLVFVLSQSGETADTLGALREARRRGHPDAGDREHRGQHDRPRGRRRHLPARRARGRRRQHQGLLGPGRRADHAGPAPGPAAASLVPGRAGRARGDRVGPRPARRGAQDRAAASRRPRHVSRRRRALSTWAATSTSRSRSRGRSSSRRSATSTPRAIPPPR